MQLAARAHQLAAEQALIGALDDPAQYAVLRDPSICHGHAGLLHITAVTAADASP